MLPMLILPGPASGPQVFLASLGELAAHSARSTWMRNFLAAGGIEAVASAPLHNSADAGKAFADSGAAIACICSSDAIYAELAEATAGALKAAGAKQVLLAGRPKAQEAALKAAGVDTFVFAGCDAIATLSQPARGARCQSADEPPRARPHRRLPMRRRALCRLCRAAPRSASATAACARRRWPDRSPCWPRCRGPSSPGRAAQPSTFRSSSRALRDFCAACGTPLSYRKPGGAIIELLTGAFDQPAARAAHLRGRHRVRARLARPSRRSAWQDHARQLGAETLRGLVSYQHPDHDTDAGWKPRNRRRRP